VIISAGYRIGPTEVESALLEHPAVADAAVVGRDDPERGAIVRAVLVLADGWEQSDRLTREIQNYVKGQTAPYKYPRVVDYVTALPRTSSGKLRRAELREEGP
jgi:acyl-coenzyme A synthetase/AMP-(fatty) acid ligase